MYNVTITADKARQNVQTSLKAKQSMTSEQYQGHVNKVLGTIEYNISRDSELGGNTTFYMWCSEDRLEFTIVLNEVKDALEPNGFVVTASNFLTNAISITW